MCFIIQINSQVDVSFIGKVKTYKDSVKTKYTSNRKDVVIDSTTFDISVYRNLYDKVHLKKGKRLQCIFNFSGSYGFPKLFVTDDTLDIQNFIKLKMERDSGKKQPYQLTRKWLGTIITDPSTSLENNFSPIDSKDSYLQYFYLLRFGSNFAYFWHAYYEECDILISNEELDKYSKFYGLRKDDFEFDEEKFNALYKIDKKPKVYWGPEYYLITCYEIWTHRGIYKCTYKISKNKPHLLEEITRENIIPIEMYFLY